MDKEKSIYEAIGGRKTIEKVQKIFYDKIYADAWMSQFFKHVPQAVIEKQQTDFMAQAFGGPKEYCGAFPVPAHKHMYITDELFDHRTYLLAKSLEEAGVSKELAEAWLYIDGKFRRGLVKSSPADCERRFKTDDIVDVPNPNKRRAS